MSQNRVVVENKSVLPVLVPSLGTRGGSSSPSWQRITRDRNTFNRLYAELYNMFIIFHAWYQNTFVHAWRGMFQRDNFLRSCEVSFCSGCDRRNSFEREIIIGNNVSD